MMRPPGGHQSAAVGLGWQYEPQAAEAGHAPRALNMPPTVILQNKGEMFYDLSRGAALICNSFQSAVLLRSSQIYGFNLLDPPIEP
jgi:hypothetical protein